MLGINPGVKPVGAYSVGKQMTEVEQTRPLLFGRAPITRSLTQIPFGHLPLAVRCPLEELCYRSSNWGTAGEDF